MNKRKLGDLCEFTQGVQIPDSESFKTFGEGLIRYLYIRDFFTDKFPVYVKDQYPKKVLNEEDIVMVNTGNTAGSVYRGKQGVLCNNAFKIKINNSNILHQDFLWHFLNSPEKEKLLSKLFNSAGQPHVGHSNIAQLKIPILPYSKQKKIAEILTTWDEAIALTEKAINIKKQLKNELANKLLFGKYRVLDLDNNCSIVSYHWFSASSDWLVVSIKDIAKEVSSRNKISKSLPVLSCTKHFGLVDSLKYFDKQIFSENTSTYKLVSKGQFVYATNHIEEGSIGYQNLYEEALISPMYTVFQTTTSKIDDGYLFKLLKTETFRRIFEANTSSSVDRRGSLRWKQFSEIKIPIPSIEEQKKISEILDIAQLEINKLLEYNASLFKQKRGLMQKLLTGEWLVPVTETND